MQRLILSQMILMEISKYFMDDDEQIDEIISQVIRMSVMKIGKIDNNEMCNL